MEILNMTFAGIPVGLLLAAVGAWWFMRRTGEVWKEWRQDRKDIKEINEAYKNLHAEYEWKPKMVNGVDCGEWVSKKTGRPDPDDINLGYDVGLD